MGNSGTKQEPKQSGQDPLRDYDLELTLPSHISKPMSNMLLAYSYGYFYPCLILGSAQRIPNGYLVFFLHSQVKDEIPSNNVIGNFMALRNCNVSFTSDGKKFRGNVYDFGTNENKEVTNFFISAHGQFTWVSFPQLFLTLAQAKQLCP
ncbi:unnamed protein product [Ceutorhynchus assimilis]|uniref:Uncharacterized protein n=1 Tax=Ceutorhynchus assimilis TaxID=467358 RepID=A0A9N9QSE2_9CUCU|nr:unnamed protein product [Ceutorhynchus assimilis]